MDALTRLQRAYLDVMKGKLEPDSGTQTDMRAIARGALQRLAKQIDAAAPHAANRETGLHLMDCRKAIERILNPRSRPWYEPDTPDRPGASMGTWQVQEARNRLSEVIEQAAGIPIPAR